MRCNKEICKINWVDLGKFGGKKKAAKSKDFLVVRSCVCHWDLGQGIPSLGLPWSWNSWQELGRRRLEVLCAPKFGDGGTNWDFSRDSQGMKGDDFWDSTKILLPPPFGAEGQRHPRALLHPWESLECWE